MATWWEITFTGEPTEADYARASAMVAQGYRSGQLVNDPAGEAGGLLREGPATGVWAAPAAPLVWESAEHDGEERDQNADTALFPHGYWSLGPDDAGGEVWSLTLIEQDENLDVLSERSWKGLGEGEVKELAARIEAGDIPLER